MTLLQYPYFHIHFLEGLVAGLVSAWNQCGSLGLAVLFIGYEVREYQVKHDRDPITVTQFAIGYTLGLILAVLFTRRKKRRWWA